MALLVVAGGAWFGYRQFVQRSCAGEVRISVTAAPELAPVIQAAADQWVQAGAAVEGRCVAIDVTGSDPADVAANVATQHGVTLTGVGQGSGEAVLPTVWVPDSSMWLLRLRNQASGFVPTNGASIAHSPVVVAMPEPVATGVGWPGKRLTWSDLLQQVLTGTRLRAGIVEPTRDSAGLSGLLALAAAAGGAGTEAQQATTSALRALATGRSALRDDLIARFPRSADPASIASSLSAAALSEEDVIRYNATKPPIQLAALYLDPTPLPLDYPYAVLPGADPDRAAAAEGLFAVLGTAQFRDRLAAAGLRAPDGTWGAGFAAPRGAPTPSPAATASPNAGGSAAGGADPTVVERALSSWSLATQSGRMLAVIDVSGSMLEKVPTANNATRSQVTVAAARRGLSLCDDSWAIGLWTFSTELVGGRDFREVVPIGPLSGQRAKLETALGSVVPKKNGDTGLYDTMLAAYQAVQEDWAPGRVNSIVMFTDGQNDDANGISRERLLSELGRIADPDRPIRVIIIGIGKGVDRGELESIAKVTNGGVFITEDPAKISDIFLQAIAARAPATR